MRRLILLVLTTVVTGVAAAAAATEPLVSIAVKTDRPFHSDPGILTLTDDGLAFEARDTARTRHWVFDAIRYVRIPSAGRIVVDTYEPARRLLAIPGLRTYTFDVAEGSVTPEFVAVLLQQFPRPVVTTVMPPLCPATWSATAWHDRGRSGVSGVLEVHREGLVFLGSMPAANRYWRFRDVASMLRLEANRVEIAVREPSGVRPYVFELKNDLPEVVFESMWRSVHPTAAWRRGV